MPLRITSKREGFRRAGVPHSASPTVWPDDAFTAEQLAALRAESMLFVEVIAEEPNTHEETAAVHPPADGQAEKTAETVSTGADASAPAKDDKPRKDK